MSFFSDINGLNAKAMKNIYEAKDESKDDFSEVDFCVNDYDGVWAAADFQDGNGNGVSDEAQFYNEIGGNGYAEIGGNGYEDIGGNGYEDIGGNGYESDSAYMSSAIRDYMESYDVSEAEAEEHFESMNFEG